jgi:predicted nucleic acid-binding protein
MPYVFDTSSLMTLLLDEGGPDVDVVFGEHVLDLTFYEAGNVLWKAHHLQGRLDAAERDRLADVLGDLRSELVVHELPDLGMGDVARTATEMDVTFYDAAYLVCADALAATLVTEDGGLRDVAGGTVSACGVAELS